MRKFLLLFLALFMTAGTPMVQADDGTDSGKPTGEEKEPECD